MIKVTNIILINIIIGEKIYLEFKKHLIDPLPRILSKCINTTGKIITRSFPKRLQSVEEFEKSLIRVRSYTSRRNSFAPQRFNTSPTVYIHSSVESMSRMKLKPISSDVIKKISVPSPPPTSTIQHRGGNIRHYIRKNSSPIKLAPMNRTEPLIIQKHKPVITQKPGKDWITNTIISPTIPKPPTSTRSFVNSIRQRLVI